MRWGDLAGFSRQTGKTTAMIKAAKELGAILLVRTHSEVQRLRSNGVTVKAATEGSEGFIGVKTPVLIDPDAFSFIFSDMEYKHSEEMRKVRGENSTRLREQAMEHRRQMDELELKLARASDRYESLVKRMKELIGGG